MRAKAAQLGRPHSMVPLASTGPIVQGHWMAGSLAMGAIADGLEHSRGEALVERVFYLSEY